MKNLMLNMILIFMSVLITILAAEYITRLYINPVNYLKPVLTSDVFLGHKIAANSSGHDQWGFRNITVPEQVDILAIGDSQTYGIMASANNSWPAALAELSKKTVYNLSLGGYGPLHYFHLLKTKAPALAPKQVIIGLYVGNDLMDTYRLTYKKSNWHHFRSNNIEDIPSKITPVVEIEDKASIRNWLAQHSVFYRIITNSFIGDLIRQKETLSKSNGHDIVFIPSSLPLNIGFNSKGQLDGLNMNNYQVREGLRISLEVLTQIKAYCDENNIHLEVVIIPTKENVYKELLSNEPKFLANKWIQKVLDSEMQITNSFRHFFEKNNISYIEPITAMRKAAVDKAIYPAGYDGHPNKNGYHIIAKVIQQHNQSRKKK